MQSGLIAGHMCTSAFVRTYIGHRGRTRFIKNSSITQSWSCHSSRPVGEDDSRYMVAGWHWLPVPQGRFSHSLQHHSWWYVWSWTLEELRTKKTVNASREDTRLEQFRSTEKTEKPWQCCRTVEQTTDDAFYVLGAIVIFLWDSPQWTRSRGPFALAIASYRSGKRRQAVKRFGAFVCYYHLSGEASASFRYLPGKIFQSRGRTNTTCLGSFDVDMMGWCDSCKLSE